MKQTPLPTDAAQRERVYLDRPRAASQKGGTLILEEISSEEAHRAALAEPDRVRPQRCPRCHTHKVHVHERRNRKVRGQVGGADRVEVLVMRCADRARCGAVWRLLPRFLARHLHRAWATVGATVGVRADEARRTRVPVRTRERWRARLELSATVLVALLDATGIACWRDIAARVGAASTRGHLVTQAPDLASLAAALDRQQPGVRLM